MPFHMFRIYLRQCNINLINNHFDHDQRSTGHHMGTKISFFFQF